MPCSELLEEIGGQERRVAGEDENGGCAPVERGPCHGDGVSGATRLGLDDEADALDIRECRLRVRRRDDDERVRRERLRGREHPVDHSPPEQRMQVLRQRRAHARAEPGGHDDGGEWRFAVILRKGWGARIRTWGRGTKTRCLTTWLRPTNTIVSTWPGQALGYFADPSERCGRSRIRR